MDSLSVLEKSSLIRKIQRLRSRVAELENLLSGTSINIARLLDLAITNAKIASLAADKITAGSFTVQIDVGNPASGYIRFDGANNRFVINDGTNNRILLSPTTFRVSLPGFNCLTEADPANYSVYADSDNVLIKEHSRGSATIGQTTYSVSHNLGYFPHFYVYGEISAGKFQIVNGYNLFGDWRSILKDVNTLDITNIRGPASADLRYFIFYDDVNDAAAPSITESDTVLKIAKDGVNALTSTNPNDFIMHTDLNTFKIIGAGTLLSQTVNANPKEFKIAHGLTFAPNFYAFCKFPDGSVAMAGPLSFNFLGTGASPSTSYGEFTPEIDSTYIYFNLSRFGSNYNVDISYVIFETPIDGGGVTLDDDGDMLLKITKDNYNALTETALERYTYHSGYDTLKYLVVGDATVSVDLSNYYATTTDIFGGTLYEYYKVVTVAHSLGDYHYFCGYIKDLLDPAPNVIQAPFAFGDAFFFSKMSVFIDANNLYFMVHFNLNGPPSGIIDFDFSYKIFRNKLGF